MRIENGKITDVFNTFADPGMPIPSKIVQLTGNHGRDGCGVRLLSPRQCRAFLQFAGDLPLIAHNAHGFDIRFIRNRSKKMQAFRFENTYIDTYPLAQALYRIKKL